MKTRKRKQPKKTARKGHVASAPVFTLPNDTYGNVYLVSGGKIYRLSEDGQLWIQGVPTIRFDAT